MKFVYVYLGESIPRYVVANIKRNEILFPESEHVLIVDRIATKEFASAKRIQTFLYIRNEVVARHISTLSHDKNFRAGFWIYSLERLFSLINYAVANPKESILHLEADVLLMPNFPVKQIEEIEGITWLKFNNSHDVASLVFFPKNSDVLSFGKNIEKELKTHQHLTDMTILSNISAKFPNCVTSLPVAMKPNSKLFSEETSSNWRIDLTSNPVKFEGIFDSAPLGMWLLGQDPRNHRGILRKYVNLQESFIQPSAGKFAWSEDEFLSIEVDGKILPVFNLHVHSKEMKYFGAKWKKNLRKAVVQSKDSQNANVFLLRIFLSSVKSGLIRRIKHRLNL